MGDSMPLFYFFLPWITDIAQILTAYFVIPEFVILVTIKMCDCYYNKNQKLTSNCHIPVSREPKLIIWGPK